jgi:hypothetical protein
MMLRRFMLASRSQPPLDDDAAFIVFVARFHAIFDKQLKPCNADSLSTVSEAITNTEHGQRLGQSTVKCECGQTVGFEKAKRRARTVEESEGRARILLPPIPWYPLSKGLSNKSFRWSGRALLGIGCDAMRCKWV